MLARLPHPGAVYQNIARLTEILLSHCEKHRIVVWPEYGSLLGWKRHRGVIPWDYDGDFGMMKWHKKELLETFAREHKSSNYYLDTDYYSDQGCMVLRFKDNTVDVIDIIFYSPSVLSDGKKLIVSKQGPKILSQYVCPYNYTYQHEWLFPLKQSLFMGHLIHIPNQAELMLEKVYGDWQTIPQEFEDYIEPRFLLPPVKFIAQGSSAPLNGQEAFRNILQIITTSKEPVIFRRTPVLDMSLEKFDQLIREEPSLYGYSSSVDWSDATIPGAEGWEQYRKGELRINIVDSPVSNQSFLPREMTDYFKMKLHEHEKMGLTWILTNAPKTTHFHTDPEYAGGYMKLLKGKKIWWCIPEEDWTPLVTKGSVKVPLAEGSVKVPLAEGHTYESLRQLDLTEIIALDDYSLWGRIQVGILEPGDLLWFPVKCLHKVITLEDSFGFGGYL